MVVSFIYMDSPNDQMLRETYRLAKENNRMLHTMRRNAFWGGVIKVVIYILLLGVPIWLYLQYLGPLLQDTLRTIQQVQGVSGQFNASNPDWASIFENFRQQYQEFRDGQ